MRPLVKLTSSRTCLCMSPSSLLNGWCDVLAADVPLGKRFFVHNLNSLSSRPGRSIPALLIVLDGCKCTLFDSGTGEDRILVVNAPSVQHLHRPRFKG